jgi:hypothetical protein
VMSIIASSIVDTQRIAFYPQSLVLIKLHDRTEVSAGDKTCWTKPRSRRAALAMGIVSWGSAAGYGTRLKIS